MAHTLIRVGTAGWSYEDWIGIVYPKPAPRGFDRLALMASLFDTNEINSTFYRIPTARQTEDWSRRVAHNPLFAFTAKLYRAFTHERDAGSEDRRAYLEALRPLADANRLGAVLVQFPVSFHATPENRGHLERILDDFSSLPLATEFRHRTWDSPETLSLLSEHGAAFVNIDQPWLGDNLRATEHVTAPRAYFRFHGRNAEKWFGPDTSNEERYDYLYSEEQLAPWADRIRRAAALVEGPPGDADSEKPASRGVYAILNNHFRGQAVANALELQHVLTGASPEAPAGLFQTYPRLTGAAREGGASPQFPLFRGGR